MRRLKVYVVTTECVSDYELIMKDVNVYSLEYNAQKKKEDTIEQDFAPFIDGYGLYIKTDEKNLFLAKSNFGEYMCRVEITKTEVLDYSI